MTLYQELITLEKINETLEEHVDIFEEILKPFENLPGYSNILIKPLPQIDVVKSQQEAFERYEKNPVLNDAINRNTTIEQTLEELSQIKKGIRSILPRRKRKAHNQRIEDLSQLITEPRRLLTRGWLFPDNYSTAIIEIQALSMLITNLKQQCPSGSYLPLLSFGILSLPLLITPIITQYQALPFGEARYLDTKIKEFYS